MQTKWLLRMLLVTIGTRDFMQRIAVVTGSSSGIGLLTTLELAWRGYRVIATMRDLARRGRLEKAATEQKVDERIEFHRLDITEFDCIAPTLAKIAQEHGRIDVLVNNAGFSVGGFAEDTSLAELRDQFETNFFGNVAAAKAAFPIMRAQGSGHIIMVSSVAGRVGQPVMSSYNASKWALEGWTEAARIEMRAVGVRLVLVEPGAFESDIWTRNVKVAAGALADNSPNKERSRRFVEFVQKDVKKRDARAVAQLIAGIAENPNPKLRYLIGGDAYLQVWLRRVLPWRTYEKIVAGAVKIDQ